MTIMDEMKGEMNDLKASADDARHRAYRAEERTMEALAQYDKEKQRADDAGAALEELRLSATEKPLSCTDDVDMPHTPAKGPFTPVRRWLGPPTLPKPQRHHVVIDLDDSSDDMSVDHSTPLPKFQRNRNATPGPSTTPTVAPPTRHDVPFRQSSSRSVHFTTLKGKESVPQRPLAPISTPKVAGESKDASTPKVRSTFQHTNVADGH